MGADRRLIIALSICVTAVLWPWQGAAAQVVETEHVRLELISELESVQPGDMLRVALAFDIREGWHIYWRNPGDSGTAPRADWRLPSGFQVSDPLWTYPERIRVGPLMNYGYSGRAYLPFDLEPPEHLPLDRPITLTADAEWLVCEEICIPESGRVALTLPVSSAPRRHDERWRADFERIRESRPRPLPWTTELDLQGNTLQLHVNAPGLEPERIEDVWFYPGRYGVIEHAAAQPLQIGANRLTLSLTPAAGAASSLNELSGILVIQESLADGVVTQSFDVAARRLADSSLARGETITLSHALALALVGGLILNLMPCVFPVLSIKALALASLAREAPRRVRLHGLLFTLGVLSSFSLLAGVLLALRAGGEQIGWGFQLQSVGFVLVLAWLMFTLGLMFSGVLTIGGRLMGVGDRLTQGNGPGSAFFTGALAVVVATPCTAPFMGGALGFALTQPHATAMAVFLALGLGLAAPWAALSVWPALYRRLPRPGPWMEHLKQLLAFPLYATAAWLIWVLSQQAGPPAIAAALGGMVLLAFAAWLWQRTRTGSSTWRRLGQIGSLATLAILIAVLTATSRTPVSSSGSATADAATGKPYSDERLRALRAEGRPVFVNFTAAWCITCLVNERVALSSEAVGLAIREKNVAYLRGDWTNRDPEITRVLERHGRSGVPLYLLYPADEQSAPEVLPQLLTEGLILERLEQL